MNPEIDVPPEAAGSRLDRYLTGRFSYHSRTSWQEQIEEGRILLNGQVTKPSVKLKTTDRIEYKPVEVAEPEVDTSFEIIHEDDYIIAVNKPANLPVHPAGIYSENTLVSLLQKQYTIYTVNRIDRETSGIVIFARDPDTASFLAGQFERKQVIKKYIAYVYGSFPKHNKISGFIGPDPVSVVKKKQKLFLANINGSLQDCVTEISLDNCLHGISRVRVFPLTGRTHQIRATLYSSGYPMVGDKIYGKNEEWFLEFIDGKLGNYDIINRQALHCEYVKIKHPRTGEFVEIHCPEPDDMKSIFTISGNMSP